MFPAYRQYVFVSDFDGGWFSGSQTSLTSNVVMESSCSCRVSGSGSNSVSGTTLIPRPSGARDLVTMADCMRDSLYLARTRVTTGVGSGFRGARAKPISLVVTGGLQLGNA